MLRWLVLLGLFASCSKGSPEARPNVLLVTIDTLRPDHLSCYGYERQTSPHLDRLAQESILFTHAQSPRAKTTPALATLLSGLYPHGHGVRELMQPLGPRVPLMPELLRSSGYRTGAVIGNSVLKRAHSGLDRGFDVWVEDLPDRVGVPPDDAPQSRAQSVTDNALATLAQLGSDAPWFLWLHYMDPHGAYDPPLEHRLFDDPGAGPLLQLAQESPRRLHAYNVPPDGRLPDGRVDAGLARDRYDGEIHYVDAQIGRLLEFLRRTGTLEETLVIVTSDHGESLGEHDYWFEHGFYAYEATCRVPLIVRLPNTLPGRRRGDVSLADILPTLLDYLELEPVALPAGHGLSRLGLLHADSDASHPVFSEKIAAAEALGTRQIKAVRMGDWKLIQHFTHVLQPESGARGMRRIAEELYELASDRREQHNLAPNPPPEAPLASLRRELIRFVAQDRNFPELAEILGRHRRALKQGGQDAEAARVLRQLGYL